jgi:hypothetical protein
MLRKLTLAAVAASSIALGGCATTGSAPTDITSFVAQVQATTSAVCAFVPTAETVASIISTLGGPAGATIVGTANGIASAICAAVAPVKAAGKLHRAVAPPTVAGVVIHGKFLN